MRECFAEMASITDERQKHRVAVDLLGRENAASQQLEARSILLMVGGREGGSELRLLRIAIVANCDCCELRLLRIATMVIVASCG